MHFPIGVEAIRDGKPVMVQKSVFNFEDHSGPLTEMVLAGNLAVRLGRKIDWDMKNMDARGLPAVKAMLKRQYRGGGEPDLT